MTGPLPDLVCPVCRTVNPGTRQFCRKCAADLRAPAPGAATAVETGRPVPVGPIIIGAAFALAVALIGIILLFALGGSPAASPTPGPTSSAVPESAAPSNPASPSVAPTTLPTSAPTIVPPPTPTGPPSSPGTGSPVVDTFKGPARASCTDDNGTGTPGYIHLEWTASNTTGIRISIDPPAANVAYDYGYDDYPADFAANVPFTCDPPNSDANGEYHLYVATTVHDRGRFAWRLLKVYIRD